MNALMGAGEALQKMAALLPKTAHLVTDNGETKEVPVSDLKVGQAFQVRSGESIPADGVITAGESTVNEALVTGEFVPLPRTLAIRSLVVQPTITGR